MEKIELVAKNCSYNAEELLRSKGHTNRSIKKKKKKKPRIISIDQHETI